MRSKPTPPRKELGGSWRDCPRTSEPAPEEAVGSNAIVVLPQGREGFEAGEPVDTLLTGPLERKEAGGGG